MISELKVFRHNRTMHSNQTSLSPDVQRTLQHYMRRARAPNTYRAYASQWHHFVAWCAVNDLACMPADAEVVAAYLASRAQAGTAAASLNVILSAIAFAHTAGGGAFDRQNPALKLVVGGIRRAHVRPPLQAEPLRAALLQQTLAGLTLGVLDRRDGALLALLYTFALRSSEVVAIDWMRPASGRGWLMVSADRMELGLLGSKSVSGGIETITLPAHANPATVRAIQDWVQQAEIEPGEPLMRPLTRGGVVRRERLLPSSISSVVKRAMFRHLTRRGMCSDEALAVANRFSAHSGRVGFYVSACEAGVEPQHIAAVARHSSLAMVRLGRRADLLRCAPHLTEGVGV